MIEELTETDDYKLLFTDHAFARALNYKLEDLGRWMDQGKEPLGFIEKLLMEKQ